VGAYVGMLEARGPTVGHPYSSDVKGSKHGNMRELRIQHKGRPYRVFYAFNPKRTAILLIGGEKTGNNRFYEEMIRRADSIYDDHLQELEREDKERK